MSVEILVDITLLVFLCITAVAIIVIRDLLVGTILLGIFSLVMAAMYLTLSAPDVAITEAAVGAGISTIMFLCALVLTGREASSKPMKVFAPLIVVFITGGLLVYATLDMPAFGDPNAPIHQHLAPHYINESYNEIGIPNIVTSILASYRGFDTLGEVFVVFAAAMAVLLLIGDFFTGKKNKENVNGK
jgi:multicomponent Na+:H+ antiporter subunit B